MLYLVLAALAFAVLLLGMLLMRVLRQLNAWADLLEATESGRRSVRRLPRCILSSKQPAWNPPLICPTRRGAYRQTRMHLAGCFAT